MATAHPSAAVQQLTPDVRVAIVAARFNAHITDELLRGCVARLQELGLDESRIDVHRVPGAFELPVAAKLIADGRRHDAIIALGCVIRGQTAHFEYVAGESARGLQNVAIASGVPVLFGVLTTENEQQARDRAGGSHGHAGVSCADGAAEMIVLKASLKR